MRRVLFSLDYQASWWREQALLRVNCEAVLSSGLRAYAEKQASSRERLAADFAAIWLQGIQDAGLSRPTSWPPKYLSISPSVKQVRRRLERNQLRKKVLASVASGSRSVQGDGLS